MTPNRVRINLHVPTGTFENVTELIEKGKGPAVTVPEFCRMAIDHYIAKIKTEATA